MRQIRIAAIAALFTSLHPLSAQTIRDSAGVHIVSYSVGARPLARWTVAPKPVVEIGGADGVGPTEFAQVMGTVRLANGNIVVANMRSNELRFFDPSGKYLKAAGRSGGGPGEFSQLRGVRLIGETLQSMDGPGGLRVFSANGDLVRQLPPTAASRGSAMEAIMIALPDGSALSRAQEAPTDSLWYGNIGRIGVGGRAVTTVLRFPVLEMGVSAADGGSRGIQFTAHSAMVLFPDRICRGWARAYEIDCYSLDGRLTLSVRRLVPPTPISDSMRKAFETSYTDVAGGAEGDHSIGAIGGLKALRLHNLPGLIYAKTLPVFASFLGSRVGEVWVRDYRIEDAFERSNGFNPPPTTTTHWNIFTADGRWIADVTLPARFTAFDAGLDYVLGVSRDMDDVERVTMLRLRRQ